MKCSNQAGMGLIEVLCGLLLSVLISMSVISTVRAANRLTVALHEHRQASQKLERVFQILENSFRRAGFYHGLSGFQLESAKQISQMKQSTLPDSAALSFRALSQTTWLKRATGSLDPALYCAVKIFTPLGSPPEFPSAHGQFAAIGVDGHLQLSAKLQRVRKGACGKAAVYSVSSSVPQSFPGRWDYFHSSSNQPTLAFLPLLIPIEQSFSLLVDSQGTLRRISHFTQENQPIEDDISAFMAEELPALHGLRWIRVTLETIIPRSNKRLRRSATFSLRPLKNLEFLDLVLP